MSGYTISHLEGANAFAALRSEWEALWDASEDATETQAWCWQTAYWQLLASTTTPVVVVARDSSGRCVALASFAIGRDRESLLRKTVFLGDKTPDYHLILADPLLPESVGCEMLRYAYQHSRSKGSFFELSNIPAESYSGRVFHEFVRGFRPAATTSNWETETFSVPLPGTIEEYVETLGSRSRRDFGYDRRRLQKDFDVEFRTYAGPETLVEALDAIEQIDRARWGSDSRYTIPSYRAFARRVATDMCERGLYRAFLLHVDSKPVAYVSGTVIRDELKLQSIGHDRSFPAKYSVGKVANFFAIEACIAERLTQYDLSRGGETYKKWLGGTARTNLHLRHFRSRTDAVAVREVAKLTRVLRENDRLRALVQRARRRS